MTDKDPSSPKKPPAGSASSSDDSKGPLSFESSFKSFASFGEKDRNSQDSITLKNIDKWIAQTDVKTTPADTAIIFSKIARQEKRLDFKGFEKFLEELAAQKNLNVEDLKNKMTTAGHPRLSQPRISVSGAASAVTDRLTNVENYTGTHKERFDESGKGKGIEGREDIAVDDGYVQGYKSKDTYDEKQKKDEEKK